MKLKAIKKIMPNIEYKQMVYQSERIFEILFEGKYMGYQFYIMNLGTHPTAYVEIPETSKLFGKDYFEIYDMETDIDVHGGLTYSRDHLFGGEKHKWFIGWDYAHAGDYAGYSEKYPELSRLSIYDKKWTTEEIFEDVVSVIQQIKKEEN